MGKKGFTLLEFIVTFGIIALIAGISVSALRVSGPSLALRSATRALGTDLRQASELANSTQAIHEARFNRAENTYTLVRPGTPETVVKTVVLTSGVRIDEITIPSDTAIFNILGAAATPGLVTLINQNGQRMTVDLRPSGYVRIR